MYLTWFWIIFWAALIWILSYNAGLKQGWHEGQVGTKRRPDDWQ